jgi:protein tyrosine phosphatase
MRIFCLISLICSLVSPSLAQYSEIERNERLAAITAADLAKLPPGEVQWLFEQTIKGKDFEKQISKVKIPKLSKRLKNLSQAVQKPNTIGTSKEHRSKNTYSAPYDETRTLRHIPNFYISASDVLTPKQAYVVGEEPTKATLSTFWKTIIQIHATTIVALCMPKQCGYYEDAYYPRFVDGWVISKISEETIGQSPFILSQKTVKRIFWATKDSQKRVINHLHLENWPDHGAAEGTLFHHLLAYVEYINPDGSSPIFVHCAAGIGRSGTFVAAHSIYKDISAAKYPKEIGINIPLRVLQMRMQRKNMLSKDVQFAAVIDSIKEKLRQRS